MSKFVVVLHRPEAPKFVCSLLFLNKEGSEQPRIVSFNEGQVHTEEDWFRYDSAGNCAIGSDTTEKGEPFVTRGRFGCFALCTAGEISNYGELRAKLRFSAVHTDSNAELFSHLIMQQVNAGNFKEALQSAFTMVKGEFVFSVLHEDCMYAGRRGDNQLFLGKIGREQKGYLLASDLRLFFSTATLERELKPDEIFVLGAQTELFVK